MYCFTQKEDFRLFFKNLASRIAEPIEFKPLHWIRAYRNMARFRPNSLTLEVFDQTDQAVILDWFIKTFARACGRNTQPGIRGQCIYLVPHLLKRRRFDRAFLEPGGPEYQKLEQVLKQAKTAKLNRNYRANVKCSLKLLREVATRGDLDKIAAADTSGD